MSKLDDISRTIASCRTPEDALAIALTRAGQAVVKATPPEFVEKLERTLRLLRHDAKLEEEKADREYAHYDRIKTKEANAKAEACWKRVEDNQDLQTMCGDAIDHIKPFATFAFAVLGIFPRARPDLLSRCRMMLEDWHSGRTPMDSAASIQAIDRQDWERGEERDDDGEDDQ